MFSLSKKDENTEELESTENTESDSENKSDEELDQTEDYSDSQKAKAFISKQWWKESGSKTMGALGKLAKSFLLPIALLPIAGLFIGLGAALEQVHTSSQAYHTFTDLLSQMGSICFSNLAVLFLISAIIAFTNDSGSAVLAGVVAFLVFNVIIAVMSSVDVSAYQYTFSYTDSKGIEHVVTWLAVDHNQNPLPFYKDNQDMFKAYITSIGQKPDGYTLGSVTGISNLPQSYNLLFWHNVPATMYVSLIGINTLNTGVFAGIVVGCVVAWVYNRTYKVNLPAFINFFSGIKFVPIVMFFAIIPLSFVMMLLWPPIGKGLTWFGQNSSKLPIGLDSFLFELVERSLVPFGLHHVYYSPLWWTAAGGGPLGSYSDAGWNYLQKHYHISKDSLSPELLSAVGDQTMCYAVIGQNTTGGPATFLTYDEIWNAFHLNLGRFQAGKFPFMMFGLTSAAVAMWLTVPKENRKSVMGIYFSAGITCFLTGVTEPIEYTFLFVAPWLFYGVHVPLAAISFWIMGALHVHVAQTVSGGFIDMTIFGILPSSTFKTHWYWIIAVGPAFSVIYFFAFYFLIKWRDVKLPGRDGSTDATLYTKADYKAKKGSKGGGNTQLIEKASTILKALGGAPNIESVDACASRLRINLHNTKIVDEPSIKALGPSAIMYRGNQCQMIFGGESDVLKSTIKDIMSGKVPAIYKEESTVEANPSSEANNDK